MGNPFAGEVTITLDGVPHVAKLTLGAHGAAPSLSRARLDELVAAFPDGRKAQTDDDNRRPDGADHSA